MLRTLTVFTAAITTLATAGPLTPPKGPPMPSGLTLNEVAQAAEPRTPINDATAPGDQFAVHIIDQPGSYFLTDDIDGDRTKFGIWVTADDVTIDLNGFTLRGPDRGSSGSSLIGHGISALNNNLTVKNGVIRDWSGSGISISNAASGAVLSNLLVDNNAYDGIRAGSNSVITDCVATSNQLDGFYMWFTASVQRCVAANNGEDGFNATRGLTMDSCTARDNARNGVDAGNGATLSGVVSLSNGDAGIDAANSTITSCSTRLNAGPGFDTSGSTITDCFALQNGTYGFDVSDSSVSGCVARDHPSAGIRAVLRCHVLDNLVTLNRAGDNSGAGILIESSQSRVSGNTMTNNGTGLLVTGPRNIIFANTAIENVINDYDIATANRVAPIVVAPFSQAVTDNTGTAAGLGTTEPRANIRY